MKNLDCLIHCLNCLAWRVGTLNWACYQFVAFSLFYSCPKGYWNFFPLKTMILLLANLRLDAKFLCKRDSSMKCIMPTFIKHTFGIFLFFYYLILKIARLENDTLTINATYLDVSIISTKSVYCPFYCCLFVCNLLACELLYGILYPIL